MTVTSVQVERFKQARVTATGERLFSVDLRVWTNDPDDGGLTVLSDYRIPRPDSVYAIGNDIDLGAFAGEAVADLIDVRQSRKRWRVTIPFSSQPRKKGDDKQYDNPLEKPPRRSGGFRVFQKALEKDLDDKPFANSAGAPFDPPFTLDAGNPTMQIVTNVAALDFTTLDAMIYCCNSKQFYDRAPGTVVFKPYMWREMTHAAIGDFFELSLPFEIDLDGWEKVSRMDVGFFELDDGEEKLILAEGMPLNEPVRLDGNGAKADPDADPEYISFRVREKKAFSALGIPTKW